MTLRERISPGLGSILFLIAAPGTVAGVVPWWISRYQPGPPFLGFEPFRWLGLVLLPLGGVLLAETFARFALVGRGTPAPIYPTEKLVVTGSYRFVRNPMYVAVLALVFGQALWFSDPGCSATASVCGSSSISSWSATRSPPFGARSARGTTPTAARCGDGSRG